VEEEEEEEEAEEGELVKVFRNLKLQVEEEVRQVRLLK